MHTLAALACIVSAATARADTRSTSVVVAPGGTNWSSTASFTKFHPSIGQLESIAVTTSAEIRGGLGAENITSNPVTTTATFAALVTLTMPDQSVIDAPTPSRTFVDSLAAFDGTVDFSGTSGVTHAGIVATDTRTMTMPPPASALAQFTGVGPIRLPVAAFDLSTWNGQAPARIAQTASATITITYTFTPWPSTAFCFGDGSGAPCPCGNLGTSGNGCASSPAPRHGRTS